MYDSKLKSNLIGRETWRETHILTQNSAQNDLIDHRINGSSFRNFVDKFWHSRSDFSLLSPLNLIFKQSFDEEIDLEEEESKIFKNWDV